MSIARQRSASLSTLRSGPRDVAVPAREEGGEGNDVGEKNENGDPDSRRSSLSSGGTCLLSSPASPPLVLSPAQARPGYGAGWPTGALVGAVAADEKNCPKMLLVVGCTADG